PQRDAQLRERAKGSPTQEGESREGRTVGGDHNGRVGDPECDPDPGRKRDERQDRHWHGDLGLAVERGQATADPPQLRANLASPHNPRARDPALVVIQIGLLWSLAPPTQRFPAVGPAGMPAGPTWS